MSPCSKPEHEGIHDRIVLTYDHSGFLLGVRPGQRAGGDKPGEIARDITLFGLVVEHRVQGGNAGLISVQTDKFLGREKRRDSFDEVGEGRIGGENDIETV